MNFNKIWLTIITLTIALSSCTSYSFPENRIVPDESYVVMYQDVAGRYFFVVANEAEYKIVNKGVYTGETIYTFDNYTRAQEEALKNVPAWIFRLDSKTVSPPFPKTVIEKVETIQYWEGK